jgi:hypothetical protein
MAWTVVGTLQLLLVRHSHLSETRALIMHRFIGAIVAAWVVYGAQYMKNGRRVPLYCQLIASGIIVCFVWFRARVSPVAH